MHEQAGSGEALVCDARLSELFSDDTDSGALHPVTRAGSHRKRQQRAPLAAVTLLTLQVTQPKFCASISHLSSVRSHVTLFHRAGRVCNAVHEDAGGTFICGLITPHQGSSTDRALGSVVGCACFYLEVDVLMCAANLGGYSVGYTRWDCD